MAFVYFIIPSVPVCCKNIFFLNKIRKSFAYSRKKMI